MKGCRIEIALKARPRMSLLVVAAVTLSGAFFSAQAQEPIKIGFGVSLTGGLASSGKAHLMSKQIWAEEINAKGGLLGRPIKLVYYDDQTNAATVPGIYAKLIDVDKVDLLMGHATNLIVAAMPLIIERKKLVMVLLALGSNAEFKYPRYFQSAAFGPDSKGVLSNNFFAVAKSLAPEPKTVALVGADAEFSNNVLIGARERAAGLLDHGAALLGVEQGCLAGMGADREHEPVREPDSLAHEVEMAVGDGIERSRKKRGPRHGGGLARALGGRKVT